MRKKLYVAIEGQKGIGKSTVCRLLSQELGKDYSVLSIKEPFDGLCKNDIVAALKGDVEIDPYTLVLLFAANRNKHLYPTYKHFMGLDGARAIISDRCFLSSLVYNGDGGVADCEFIMAINGRIWMPDLTVILDAPYSVVRERQRKRVGNQGIGTTIYEVEADGERYRGRYLKVTQWLSRDYWHSQGVITVNAETSNMNEIIQPILKAISQL